MSQIEIKTFNEYTDKEEQQFQVKDNQVINTTSDNTSQSENQPSTDDQNSSRDTQKGNESIYSKEDQHGISSDKGNDNDSSPSLFMTDGINQTSNENEQKQHQEDSVLDKEGQSQESSEENIQNLIEQKQSEQGSEKQTRDMIKESKELDKRVQDMIKNTQDSIQKTLDSTNRTLQSVAQTMKDIDETNKKFDQFNNMYESTMNQFGQKLAEVFGPGNLENEDDFMPQVTDVEELAQSLKYKTEVVFVLGKGVLDGEKSNLQSREFYEKSNEEYWKVYGIVKERISMNGSNEVDNSIGHIVNKLQDASTNSTLITTSMEDGLRAAVFQLIKKEQGIGQGKEIRCNNRDQSEYQKDDEEEMKLDNQSNQMATYDHRCKQQYYDEDEEQKYSYKDMESNDRLGGGDQFDFDLFSGKYNYFQIHGNINFIRCSNQECENRKKPEFYQSCGPIIDKPLCSLCKSPMRPHVKFIEEETDENTYNIDWVKAKINSLDCLVLVGLDEDEKNEPLYKELIQKCIEYGILIVEISMQPHLEIGHIRQLIGYPQEMLQFLKDQLVYG